jgi:hypothetical protein
MAAARRDELAFQLEQLHAVGIDLFSRHEDQSFP